MHSFVAAKELARKKAGVADHILTQTYPLVKDPKLLIGVLQNVFDSVDAGMGALLAYEEEMKRIPPTGDSFESRLTAFRQHIVSRYEVPMEFLRFVSELRETMQEHRRSPMEFSRQGSFVICDDSYRIRTLNAELLKRHVQRAKAFVALVEEKVSRNDAVIARRG